ncbi:MAG: hypothetical protein HY820_15110 [Acidobacteria bacterium]|nr:hypothetical protein [Acidobacteriota bacterium]
MAEELTPDAAAPEHWPSNYFNYFTEIEEHFQRARGTSLFLLSPLDWALIETWKNSGIPLDAVLRGIDVAFEKWKTSRRRMQQVNSLAYCAQAVMHEAQIMLNATPERPPGGAVEAPFSATELGQYLANNAEALRQTRRESFLEMAAILDAMAAQSAEWLFKLEELEQRLTAMEDKLLALARSEQSEEDLFQARRDLDSYLRPYRGKMTADQLSMLEKQFLDRRLFEKLALPRLSLFYMH